MGPPFHWSCQFFFFFFCEKYIILFQLLGWETKTMNNGKCLPGNRNLMEAASALVSLDVVQKKECTCTNC